MIKRGARDWNYAFRGACESGHVDIINLMIEKGADNWNAGLRGACGCGHINVVNMMIEKGANDWNGGLIYAKKYYHINIVKIMVDRGATNIDSYYDYNYNYMDIVDMLELGLPIDKLKRVKGIDKLISILKEHKETTYNELYQYMPKVLVNVVCDYCLL